MMHNAVSGYVHSTCRVVISAGAPALIFIFSSSWRHSCGAVCAHFFAYRLPFLAPTFCAPPSIHAAVSFSSYIVWVDFRGSWLPTEYLKWCHRSQLRHLEDERWRWRDSAGVPYRIVSLFFLQKGDAHVEGEIHFIGRQGGRDTQYAFHHCAIQKGIVDLMKKKILIFFKCEWIPFFMLFFHSYFFFSLLEVLQIDSWLNYNYLGPFLWEILLIWSGVLASLLHFMITVNSIRLVPLFCCIFITQVIIIMMFNNL